MRKSIGTLAGVVAVVGCTTLALAQTRELSQKGLTKKDINAIQQASQNRHASESTPTWSNVNPANDPAAPPANDDCAAPEAVAIPSSTMGTTVEATPEAGLVSGCGTSGSTTGDGVWYTLVGNGNMLTLTTCNAFSDANHEDTKIGVYTGACPPASLTCVTGNDDGCAGFNGFLSTATFCSTMGVPYRINVRDFNAALANGGFQLDVMNGAPCGVAAGSTCANAQVVAPDSFNSVVDHGGWFKFTADDAIEAIETCGSTFDSLINIYDSCGGTLLDSNDDCNAGSFGAGSDPGSSCFGTTVGESCVCFDTTPSTMYWVEVTHWLGGPPTAGATLALTTESLAMCAAPPVQSACCDDASGTCFDNNPPGGCFAGETEYPALTCAEVEANGDCPDPILSACCEDATGTCFDDNLPGGCFAGETEYPGLTCAEVEANGDCPEPPPCELSCLGGSIPEGEPTCGLPTDTVNGGCNVTPNAYQPIACGQTRCGTSRADGPSRDLDWYQFTLTQPTIVTWTVTAQFPVNALVFPLGCPVGAVFSDAALDCETAVVTQLLAPGTYVGFVGPQLFTGTPCGRIYNATLTCTATDACCDGNTGICTDNVAQQDCGLPPPDVRGASGLNIPVPDGGGDASCATHTINVTGAAFNVTDVNVGLSLTHSWVGDVKVSVEHNATTVMVIDQPGVPASTFGCSTANYAGLILDDEGAGGPVETLCVANASSPPNYTPPSPLSAFDGMPALGNWTIKICDYATPDTGPLTAWSVQFPGSGPPDPLFSWHPETYCSDVNCVIQNGACCNNQTGDCVDDVFEADCDGPNERWELTTNCVDLIPPCEPPRGACCNDATGACVNNVFQASCVGQRWSEGTLCANISPPCEAPRGACCEGDGTCANDVFQADCDGPTQAWAQDQDCNQIVCGVPPVPTVTQWGLIIMTLGGLALGSVLFGRRLRSATA
ncbi:MAG: hypothetical protein HOP29_15235 [Phycisphaerales bacterium]|nr:hypothetical protein [Phycisphaerales bacterium]